jgi:alpha-L-fucosidase
MNLFDGRNDTYWATDDSVLTGEVTVDLGRATAFNVIRIREAIRFGQRIDAIAVDRWNSGSWELLASAAGIGCRRLIRLDRPMAAARLRLRVTQASASPVLTEFALFAEG